MSASHVSAHHAFASHHATFNHVWSSLLLEELFRLGVRDIALASGSRSAPLTMAAAARTRPAVAQHLSETLQQVLAGVSARSNRSRTYRARGQELSQRPFRSLLGRSNLAESRACPKPRHCKAGCRCPHRACEVPTLRMSDALRIAWNPATTVRETRPNARVKPRRVVKRSTWQALPAM